MAVKLNPRSEIGRFGLIVRVGGFNIRYNVVCLGLSGFPNVLPPRQS